MTDNYNPARPNHRIRTRRAASHLSDWELLQALLGLAFTIQQEPKAQVDAPTAGGQHPALARIAAFAQNLTEASGAAIALGDADGMTCVARSGVSAPPVGAELNAADGLSGECIRLAQPVVCVNAAADPRVNYQACRVLNIVSLLYLPLYSSQKKLMGILGVFSPQPLHFSQRDISCLRPIERLVQEALGSTAENPDPATLGALLRQAGIEESEQAEADLPAAATVFDIPLAPLPPVAVRPQIANPVEPALPKTPEPPKPRAAAIFVGRVVDDAVVDEPLTRDEKSEEESEGRSRIPVMLVVLVIALLVSAVYKSRPWRTQPYDTSPVPTKVAEPQPAIAAPVTISADSLVTRRLTQAVSMASTESEVVFRIDLPKAIRYEGYQIDHPDRIYFDLHDVKLSDDKGSEFKNADGLVSGVRLFTYANGVTRVVFDLRHPASFAAKLDERPARLTIELKRVGEASKISEADPLTKPGLHRDPNSP